MDSGKMSQKSSVKFKAFGNTIQNPNMSGQLDSKPKSRFQLPNMTINQPTVSQKQSIKQIDTSQQSKRNDENLAAFLVPDGMTRQEYQQSSVVEKFQFVDYQPVQVKEPEVETPTQITECIPYQISAYYHFGPRQNFNLVLSMNDSDDRNTRKEVNYQETEIGQFGDVGVQMIANQKLIYLPDKSVQLTQQAGRLLPVILEALPLNQDNIRRVSIKLSEQVQGIFNQIKENTQQFDQVVKELSKYSVVSQIKQIVIDRSYQKVLDRLNQLQFIMSNNLNKINELIQLTEGQNEKVPAVSMPNMIDFIIKLPQQKSIELPQLRYATFYTCQVMCKQLEVQEEQCISCSQFVIQFNQGVDAVQILYDFSKLKMPKLYNKLDIANNKLNLIVLPYQEYYQKNDFILQDIQKVIFSQSFSIQLKCFRRKLIL